MAFGIDDIALIAENVAEVSEVVSETSGTTEIIGDGICEEALNLGEESYAGEISGMSTTESSDIVGDGISESSLEETNSLTDAPNPSTEADAEEISGMSTTESSDIVGDGISESSLEETNSLTDTPNPSTEADAEDTPRRIKTINDGLEGQKHPETDVPYEKKVVVTDTGEKVEGVFPQFESKFDAKLPEDLEKASDRKQFEECNRQLKEKCDSDPEFKSKFTPEQQADIDEGRTPEGYTWHHNEEKGRIQLVDSDTHAETRHTGGRNIWGGGTESRY